MISAILALYSSLLKSCIVIVVVIILISVYLLLQFGWHIYVSVCVFLSVIAACKNSMHKYCKLCCIVLYCVCFSLSIVFSLIFCLV